MDLRPAINVIAQVSLSLDEEKGAAVWMIESLDPMSMEPTDDVMQGVLPVNVNGNGQGELAFFLSFQQFLGHTVGHGFVGGFAGVKVIAGVETGGKGFGLLRVADSLVEIDAAVEETGGA